MVKVRVRGKGIHYVNECPPNYRKTNIFVLCFDRLIILLPCVHAFIYTFVKSIALFLDRVFISKTWSCDVCNTTRTMEYFWPSLSFHMQLLSFWNNILFHVLQLLISTISQCKCHIYVASFSIRVWSWNFEMFCLNRGKKKQNKKRTHS